MSPAWIGVIATIAIYMIGNIITLVWLISTIRTDIAWIKDGYIKLCDSAYSQKDAAKDFAARDREMKTIWDKVDEVRKKVYGG